MAVAPAAADLSFAWKTLRDEFVVLDSEFVPARRKTHRFALLLTLKRVLLETFH
jgi:hypothetical protein